MSGILSGEECAKLRALVEIIKLNRSAISDGLGGLDLVLFLNASLLIAVPAMYECFLSIVPETNVTLNHKLLMNQK